jgi:glycosyltransferase involved in cell wall biosynthesis
MELSRLSDRPASEKIASGPASPSADRTRPTAARPSGRAATGPIVRLLLTDHPESDREAAGPHGEELRLVTRDEIAALSPARLCGWLRRLRAERFEILSEDLDWHERIIRLHLMGALAASRARVLLDRRGRREPLGPWPLLSRQIPGFVAGLLRAGAAIPRLSATLGRLARAARVLPHPPERRRAELLYLRSDLWRGLRAGGSVGHITGMAEAFLRAGRPLSFLCADPPAGIDAERMPIHVVPPPRTLRVSRQAARFEHSFVLARAGRSRFAATPPGALYHRFDEGSIAGVLLSRALGVPLLLEYNGSGVWIADHWERPLPHRRLFEAIERVNLRHAHLVVTVSRALRDDLLARGVEPDRILVCPNGVDPEQYRPDRDGGPVRRRLGLQGRIVVGFIGTFGPWHGAPVLAAAIPAVLRLRPEASFLFVGEGPELARVRGIVQEAGVEDRCHFTGLVPQHLAPDYLAACDLLVSPHVPNPDGSPFFGSPTKLFEYMAMGRAIVASRLEQIGEVLEDGRTALLVPPGDALALAAALQRLLGDAALRDRLGRAARDVAVSRHTWDRNAARVLERLGAL